MEGQIPDVDRFPIARRVFRRCLYPFGLEAHPFHVGWYNELVEPIYRLNYHADTVAFAVISGPDMFERATLRYCKEKYAEDPGYTTENPLDDSMAYYFGIAEMELNQASLEAEIIKDFDVDEASAIARPKVLIQTAAHCSGAVEYFHIHRLEKFKLDDDSWIKDAKLFGVAIHPTYGGWFGIRAVIVCKALVLSDLLKMSRPERPIVVNDETKIWQLLKEFCVNWKEDTWREIIPHHGSRKYSTLFKNFLSIDRGIKRWEFLRDSGNLITGPNDYDVSGDTQYDD